MLKCMGISYATVLRLDLVAAGERGLQVVADLPTCCGNFFREGARYTVVRPILQLEKTHGLPLSSISVISGERSNSLKEVSQHPLIVASHQ